MAWMVVHREVNYARPQSKFSFNAKPKREPQSWPRDFVDYAVSKGWAVKVPPPKRETRQS